MIFPDGKKVTGQFKNDRLDGIGIMIWANGKQEKVQQTDDRTFKVVLPRDIHNE